MKKLLNPFVYFSGGTTLCAGLVIMAAMVFTAGATGQTFRGLLSFGLGNMPYWKLALHLFSGWAVFSLLLYGAGRIFSPSHIRLIDIAGNQALAKFPAFPFLVYSGLSAEHIMDEIEQVRKMGILEAQSYTPSAWILISGIAGIIVLVWFFAWSWKGFSIAANMRGWKAVLIYIACYIATELLTSLLSLI